jgi:hypothetical protein
MKSLYRVDGKPVLVDFVSELKRTDIKNVDHTINSKLNFR